MDFLHYIGPDPLAGTIDLIGFDQYIITGKVYILAGVFPSSFTSCLSDNLEDCDQDLDKNLLGWKVFATEVFSK